jgi:hypothetical protein
MDAPAAALTRFVAVIMPVSFARLTVIGLAIQRVQLPKVIPSTPVTSATAVCDGVSTQKLDDIGLPLHPAAG